MQPLKPFFAAALLAFSIRADAQTSRAPEVVRVEPSVQFQTWEGWGTSLAWFAYVLGGAPDKIRNDYADLIFDEKKGLGFNIARYNIGGGENPLYLAPNKQFLQPRAAVPGYQSQPGKWDWTADATQRWFLQAARQRGANHLEAFSNSPPHWMTLSGSVTGNKDGADNLDPKHYRTFAEYLTTVNAHFRDNWGVVFRNVEPFNEPDGRWWKFGNGQEGAFLERPTQNSVIKILGPMLAAKTPLSRISASDDNNIDNAVQTFAAMDDEAKGYIARINTHSYGGTRRVQLWNAAQSAGKELWMSEVGESDASGLPMSSLILADIKQLRASAWVYWQAVDEVGAGGWGLLASELNKPTDFGYKVNPKYFVLGQYSKFIRPGAQILFISDDQSLAAYNAAAQILTIVSTNDGDRDRPLSFDLSGFARLRGPVQSFRSSATEKLVALPKVSIARDHRLNVIARPKSVTTWVIRGAEYRPSIATRINDNVAGNGLHQWQYSGSWQAAKGAHRSGRANDEVTIHFSGPQLRLFAPRSSSSGITSIAVDGGSPVEVDLYAPRATQSTLIYASPTLPGGTHTLRLRVTGRKHPASSGHSIAFDRAEIVAARSDFVAEAQYQFVNRKSGLVLNVDKASKNAGAPLIQWTASHAPNELWHIVPISQGRYEIVGAASGHLMDGTGGVLHQTARAESAQQRWRIEAINGRYYRVINGEDGRSLAVRDASTADAAAIVTAPNSDSFDQQWSIVRIR